MTLIDHLRRFVWYVSDKPYRVKYIDGQWSRKRTHDEAESLASIFGGVVYTEYEYHRESQRVKGAGA